MVRKYVNIFYFISYVAMLSFLPCIIFPNLSVVFPLKMLHHKNYLLVEFVMCFVITSINYFHLMHALLLVQCTVIIKHEIKDCCCTLNFPLGICAYKDDLNLISPISTILVFSSSFHHH